MPMKCKACSHAKATEINEMLGANQSYVMIANKFNLSWQSVRNHAVKHVKPLIKAAEERAEAIIVDTIVKRRLEVNLPPLDKVKMLQERILNDLDACDIKERGTFYREFRGALQEEFKLAGLYQQERDNPANDTLEVIRKRIQKIADEQKTTYQEELKIYLDEYADKLQPVLKTQLASELVN